MSKTFKSVNADAKEDLLVVLGVDEGVNIHTESPVDRCGVSIAPSDAPALALAILEAAGFKAEFHAAGTFQDGDCWQLENVAQVIKDYLSIKDAEAAEAKEQAELEAEALELSNRYITELGYAPIESWDGSFPEKKSAWLAVARKAREIGAEK